MSSPPSQTSPAATPTDLFTRSVHEVLGYLTERTALPNWSISRVAAGEQVHLHVEADALLAVGQRVDWNDSFCHRMVDGAATVVVDSTLDPDYADLPDVPAVRAYAGTPLRDEDGELFGILCGVSDRPLHDVAEVDADLVRLFGRLLSTQLAAARQCDLTTARETQALAASETDALTGLLNRRGWDLGIAEAQHRVDTYGDLVAIVVVDLDGLKQVNDEQGHTAGDALIVDAARILRDSVREADRVARYGGDEFTVLLDGVSSAQLPARVDDLVQALAAAGISASAGGEVSQPGHRDLLATFAAADAAMYATKRARRGTAR